MTEQGMLKLCVHIEGEDLSKEQTLLKLLDGSSLLSVQMIPSSSQNISRKNLQLGEHWELQFRTESDLLNTKEILQKHTDVYTIIEKHQTNKNSRNGEDQVEEGDEEEDYEIIWSHQSEGSNANTCKKWQVKKKGIVFFSLILGVQFLASGIDKVEEIHTEAEQKENNIVSDQQQEEIPQLDQVVSDVDGNKRKHSNQFEIDEHFLSANLKIDQQINSPGNSVLNVDSQPEQQIERNSDNNIEHHAMLDFTLESTEVLINQEETHKRNLTSDAVEKTQYEQETQPQQGISERLGKEESQQRNNLLENTKEQQQQPLELLNDLKKGQSNEIKENKSTTQKNTKQDSCPPLLKNIINYSKLPIFVIGIIYLCYLFQTQ